MLDKYDVVIFDCDGVLVDSNKLKSEAFEKTLSNYSDEIIKMFLDYHKSNGGISRYKKFEFFITDILGLKKVDTKLYNQLLDKYASEVKKAYEASSLTKSCEELLGHFKKRKKKMFVASGSDELELRDVLDKKGIAKYFDGIFGSPKTKIECLSVIEELTPNGIRCFIGDSIVDLKASNSKNIDFVYMRNYSEQPQYNIDVCEQMADYKINSLEDLRSEGV